MKEWDRLTVALVWMIDCVAIILWLICKRKPK